MNLNHRIPRMPDLSLLSGRTGSIAHRELAKAVMSHHAFLVHMNQHMESYKIKRSMRHENLAAAGC